MIITEEELFAMETKVALPWFQQKFVEFGVSVWPKDMGRLLDLEQHITEKADALIWNLLHRTPAFKQQSGDLFAYLRSSLLVACKTAWVQDASLENTILLFERSYHEMRRYLQCSHVLQWHLVSDVHKVSINATYEILPYLIAFLRRRHAEAEAIRKERYRSLMRDRYSETQAALKQSLGRDACGFEMFVAAYEAGKQSVKS